MRTAILAFLVIAAVCSIVAVSPPTFAGLVDDTAPKHTKAVQDRPAKDVLAEQVGLLTTKKIDPEAVEDGIPQSIAAFIHYKYEPIDAKPTEYAKPKVSYTEQVLGQYRPDGAKFDARWAEYTARKAVVDKAIAAAADQRSAKSFAAARATLEAVITPVKRDAEGRVVPRPRTETLLARDSELPALLALADVYKDQGDVAALFDVLPALEGRRRVLDIAEERVLWFIAAHDRQLFELTDSAADVQVRKAIELAAARAADATSEGRKLAFGFVDALPSYGVRKLGEFDQKAKKGEWVRFTLVLNRDRAEVTDDALKYRYDGSTEEAYDCRATDKLKGINLHTGQLSYEEKCKFKMVIRKSAIDAAFATPPADWGRSGAIILVGKVERVAPWKLTGAFVPDTRSLDLARNELPSP